MPRGSPFPMRVRRLRARMKESRLDALLVTAPNDVRYLTGFHGEASCALLTPSALTIISDSRFEEELSDLKGRTSVVIRKGSMIEAQAAAIRSARARAAGFQPESVAYGQHRALVSALGARRLRPAPGIVAGLRLIKDEHEVAIIRRAIRLQEAALRAVLPELRPGMTEGQAAAILEHRCRLLGAEGMSFPTIVAAGANSSRPHYRPGRTRLAAGRPLLIDWGVRVQGYCSDMTRTFSLGRWSRALGEVYRVVLEAHNAALGAARPGLPASQLDALARGIIAKAGYGPAFGHALGHGIGLDIHEGPRLAREIREPLETGMVVTIEPGVYLPGVGGVRIEDDILITARGARSLCSLPKDIRWATLNG